MRGDITSQDRSIAATQQDYFANVDKAELGRPDSFEKLKSDVPQDYMNVARVLNLSEWKIATKILFPAVLPYMLTGVRLAVGTAWLVIVAAEMLTGGVGIGFSQHAGQVIVCDGTPEADERIRRVLANDPMMGVFRHADAGYDDARRCADDQGVDIPMRNW